ncbi:MAG TPA: iron chelate uptake ABC transporter family permease subunit [Bacillota bacterium]|nr:iron chelate uptake ABC transporter family permease subunit [Bacillota bacterium]
MTSGRRADDHLARRARRWRLVLAVLAAALLAACLLGLGSGAVTVPVGEVARILLSRVPRWGALAGEDWPASHEVIVVVVRAPRVVLAAAVGATLGIAGAAFQGLLGNPMADPYVIGASSGAALGATLAMTAGGILAISLVPAAFLGALAAVTAVYLLAREGGRVPQLTLLLAGVAVGSFLAAIVSGLILLSQRDVRPVIFWLMGGFSGRGWSHVLTAAPYLGLGTLVVLAMARELNALLLGEESARQLGVDTERAKLILILGASLGTAAAVAVSGIIGFVGLVVPHLTRLWAGSDHRILLPASALAGATLLVLADLVARTALPPLELPVGVVTSLLGGPFFLFLLRRARGGLS